MNNVIVVDVRVLPHAVSKHFVRKLELTPDTDLIFCDSEGDQSWDDLQFDGAIIRSNIHPAKYPKSVRRDRFWGAAFSSLKHANIVGVLGHYDDWSPLRQAPARVPFKFVYDPNTDSVVSV